MATNIRPNFAAFFGTTKLPELEAVIVAKAENYPSMIPILFNEEMMSTDIYQTTTLSGVSNPSLKPENTPVTFQTIKPGYNKTYTAFTYAIGYRISKEAVDDGKYNFIKRATDSFAKGMFEIKELNAAQIFDDGFTVNGYDGVPLFSTAHPLENAAGFGVNRPAVASALSLTSFRELRNILQDTVNEDGQLIRYQMQYLVVPQDLQDTAAELMKSAYQPTNANNAINSVYQSAMIVPGGHWQYLGSQTAWFITAPKEDSGLMWLTRENFNTTSDYDKVTFAWEVIGSCRFAQGYSSWRGVVGNPGA